MEQYIINYCKNINVVYIKINNNQSLNIIYDLFKNSIKIIDIDNDIICLYYGVYYEHIEKNYDEMKKYYLMAIEKGNIIAMNIFACYYEYIEKNYDEMKKYFLMAIEKGDNAAMYNLGYYYQYIEYNYDEMKKYYLMAIEKGHDGAKKRLLECYKMNIHNININMNDVIKILNKLGEHQLKYKYIEYGLNNNKHIDFNLTGNYTCASTIQFVILKYINKLCDKKILYEKYNDILLLLYSIKQNKLNIPKYLKFNIIYYITQ